MSLAIWAAVARAGTSMPMASASATRSLRLFAGLCSCVPTRSAPLRYIVAVAIAFALNQGVLTLAKLVLPTGKLWSVAAQGSAAVSYTAALFLLSHFWVFAHRETAEG